jgi:hypothetical protein
MTVINPPIWLNDADVNYTADDQRRYIDATMGGRAGIVFPGDLAPSQRPTPDMKVRIAGGRAFIANSLNTMGGMYMVDNGATADFTDVDIDPSDPTPRYDRIIAEVEDEQYAGTQNRWRLHVVKGTPSGTPAEPSLAAFNNYMEICRVLVGANVTTIVNGNLLDRRISSTKGQATALGGKIVTTSTNLPTANLYEGVTAHQTDTNLEVVHNGTAWMGAGAFVAPPPVFYNFGPASADFGLGHVNDVMIAAVIVAPYPLSMFVEASGNGGFGASGVCRGNIRFTNHAGTAILSPGAPYLGGNSGGELTLDVGSPYHSAFHIFGQHDFAAGANCGFRLQHACVAGSNFYLAGTVKVTFVPKVS